jgi:membrane fusion protein, multidrug efflux system
MPLLFVRSATLLASLLLFAAGCGSDVPPAAGGGNGPRATPVITAEVRQQQWSDTIEALGTARANESLTLSAKVSETVERVNFEDGDLATEGMVLVDLSGRAEVASLEEAQAAYTEALQQFERLNELVGQGTVARSALDSAIATRDAARARMNAIRARLSDRVITAPFAGLLGFRQVSPGTLVTPGTAIATLDDISVIKLDFSVPETFLAALAPGQRIEARSAAWAGQVFEGVVSTLDSRVDPVTRAIVVRAEIPNKDAKLRPGMLLTVSLQQAPRPLLAVPELALVQVGTTQSVFRLADDGSVEQVTVRSGSRRRGEVEIVEGLAAGDRIVVEGVGKLRPGMRVADVGPDAAAPQAASDGG